MEKYIITYPKYLKLTVVIFFIVLTIVTIFLVYETSVHKDWYDVFSSNLKIGYCVLIMVLEVISIIAIFRRKITVDGDKIKVRKLFKTEEYSLNNLYKVSVETRHRRKIISEITLYKEKHVYFSFGEGMVNADLLIDTLVRRCLIERKSDGSYVARWWF